jgi:hypothetical protein
MTVAEKVYEKLKTAPDSVAQEVLDFVTFLEAKNRTIPRPKKSMRDFVGILEGSPALEGDPAMIQRAMRDEWD